MQTRPIFFIPNKRFSYIFNSKISGIDDSDLCVLVGTNLRKEAPLINARLRQKIKDSGGKFKIINFGKKSCISLDFIDGGDVYSSLSNLKDQKFSGLLKKSKNPLFIIGQGPLISKDGESLFYFLLDLYNKNSKTKNGQDLIFFKIIPEE